MLHQKENGGAIFSSVSDFLMKTCPCLHDDNGYFKSECCIGEYSKCKNLNHPAIENLNKGVLVNSYMNYQKHLRKIRRVIINLVWKQNLFHIPVLISKIFQLTSWNHQRSIWNIDFIFKTINIFERKFLIPLLE